MATRGIRWQNRLLLPLFLLVLAAVYIAAAFRIQPQFSEGLVGRRFMPLAAAFIMVAALLRVIWKDLPQEGEGDESGSLVRPFLVLLAMVLYVAAFPWLGYVLSTLLLTLVLFQLFRFQEGRFHMRLAYAVAVTAVFYAMFALAFGIRLPTFMGVI